MVGMWFRRVVCSLYNDHSRGGGLISAEKLVGRERERNLLLLFAIRTKLIEPFRFPVVLCYRQSILLLDLPPVLQLSFYICPGVYVGFIPLFHYISIPYQYKPPSRPHPQTH